MIYVGEDFDAGRSVWLPLPGDGGAHVVVAGSSGGGKTQMLHALLCQLAELQHTALVISDPAQMDFLPWAPRASCVAYGRIGASWLLDQVEREMSWRLREGRRLGVQRIVPSAAIPRLIVVVDEVSMVTLGGPKGAALRLVDIAQVGRKVSIGLVLATQSPKATVLPRLVLEQCPSRICFRTEEPEQTDAILGTQRIPAHSIPFRNRGEGYVRLPDGGYAHVKAAYADDERIARAVRETAHLTPTLPADRGWQRTFDPTDDDSKETA